MIKKVHYAILKGFTKHKTGLLNVLINILQWYLWLNMYHFIERLEILTPKHVLQRLPIALAQVKADNTFENLLNEILQILYSLYPAKKNY